MDQLLAISTVGPQETADLSYRTQSFQPGTVFPLHRRAGAATS
jgi:hypothetical protein